MISVTETFLQQWPPMPDGIRTRAARARADDIRPRKPATVVCCIAHFELRQANMLLAALSGVGRTDDGHKRKYLPTCERMSQGALLNLLTRSDATFRGAMAGSSPDL